MFPFSDIPSVKTMVAQLKKRGTFDEQRLIAAQKTINKIHYFCLALYPGFLFIILATWDEILFGLPAQYIFFGILTLIIINQIYMQTEGKRQAIYLMNFGEEISASVTATFVNHVHQARNNIKVYYKFEVSGRIYKGNDIFSQNDVAPNLEGQTVPVRYYSKNPKINCGVNARTSVGVLG